MTSLIIVQNEKKARAVSPPAPRPLRCFRTDGVARLEKRTMEAPRPTVKASPLDLDSSKNRWIAVSFAHRAGANPDAVQTADATIAIWHDIAAALKPVIGAQGIAALYDRSVTLTARKHPWLIPQRLNDDHSVNLDALHSVMARQTTTDATSGASELLQTFYGVLVSLIGSALSEQLLSSVREAPGSPRSGDSSNL
jgi:hypothetical protein